MLHSSNPNYSYAKVHLDCRIGTPVARCNASSSIEALPPYIVACFSLDTRGTLGAYESSFKDPAYLPWPCQMATQRPLSNPTTSVQHPSSMKCSLSNTAKSIKPSQHSVILHMA